jgi:hypothetical protein
MLGTPLRTLLILLPLSLQTAFGAPVEELYKFNKADTSCGGYPRLPISTMEGTCLGVVATASLVDERLHEGLKFPRKILQLEKNRFLISDMGGWDPPNRGGLWELDLRGGKKRLFKRLAGMRLPHDLQWGPDGNLYIGEMGRISRVQKKDLIASKALKTEIVINNLPTNLVKPNLHPLVKFTFGITPEDKGHLYVNVGAPTDACTKEAPYKCKTGEQQGLIRKYTYLKNQNTWNPQYVVWAKGLRNSMGLVFHPSGTLLQGENSRDFKQEGEPFDEINWILPNRHYGWPYCYNFVASSPEWKIDCTKNYASPYILLPPHSAPLEMFYYEGKMFPQLNGHLMMSWHSSQPTGSRIVAYPVDEKGLPKLSGPDWMYGVWEAGGVTKKQATPNGGNLRSAKYLEVVNGWNKKVSLRAGGTPVGMTVDEDGAIWIVEDKNKTILILTTSSGPAIEEDGPDDKIRVAALSEKLNSSKELQSGLQYLNQNVFQKTCIACHGGLEGDDAKAFKFLADTFWIGGKRSLITKRVRAEEGLERMPRGGSLPTEMQNLIEKWARGFEEP